MPLKHTTNDYSEEGGIEFVMANETGETVVCRISRAALRDHKGRLHHPGSDAEIFTAYREVLERLASEAYESGGPYDQQGNLIVTSEALAQFTRSA